MRHASDFMTASMDGYHRQSDRGYSNTKRTDRQHPRPLSGSVYPKLREITGTNCLGDGGTAIKPIC